MVIDFHTHTFPDRIAAATIAKLSRTAHITPFSDGTKEGLLSSMRESGVDLSVILPIATSPQQTRKINDGAAENNARAACAGLNPGGEDSAPCKEGGAGRIPKVFSFGAVHPDNEDYRSELARAAELGLKGIKVHPFYQDTDVDDIRYLRIFGRAAELGLVVVTHAGADIGYPGAVHCSPDMCRHVVREIGEFRFVLAHMGGWRCWEEVPEKLSGCGVYLDTAFSTGRISPLPDGYWDGKDLSLMGGERVMEYVRAFGADHILFGTDSPWSPQKESREFIEKLPLTPEEQSLILGGNAVKLLS